MALAAFAALLCKRAKTRAASIFLPDAIALLPSSIALMPDSIDFLPDVVALLPDAIALLPDLIALLPNLVTLLPNSIALLPSLTTLFLNFTALLPHSTTLLPDLVTLLLNSIALLLNSIDLLLNTVTLLPIAVPLLLAAVTLLPIAVPLFANLIALLQYLCRQKAVAGSVAVVFVWAYAMLTAAMTVAKTVTQDELLRLIDKAAAERWTTLDLAGHGLSELPPEIGKLTNLKTLVLGRWDKENSEILSNNLRTLPDEIGQLTELRSLFLYDNQFAELPEAIGKLSELRSLHLSCNQLKELPEFLGQLTNLRSLHLSCNQLKELPEFLGQLTNLRSLDLSGNQLREVPSVVETLTSLQNLNLWDNKISQLPSWIHKLTTLETLDLRANRLPIPPEILGGREQYFAEPASALEVIDYYFKEKSDTPLYEAKLLIVGEGGAGKTTLAKKLQDADYKLKEDEKSTEGIEVLPYKFNHPDGPSCKVNIWDFGGQEIYHATHQFFLTERAAYALVTDSRQGNTDFYFWLNVIQLHGADSPVILIKNEKQGRPCSVPDLQLRGQFANLKESIETDLSENRNLEKIKATVEQYISNLSHVGDPLPKTWANVRSVLENQALGSDKLHLPSRISSGL